MGLNSGDIIVNIKEKSLWKVLSIKSELIEAEAVNDVEKTYIKKGFLRNITKC